MSAAPHTTAQKKDLMLKALKSSLGVVEAALEKLRLKGVEVGRRTYYDWLKNDAKFKARVEDLDGTTLDFAEAQQLKLMQGYTLPDCRVFMVETTETFIDEEGRKVVRRTKKPVVVDVVKHVGPNQPAVEFYLETKGKKRGYDKKLNVKVSGIQKLKIVKSKSRPSGPGATLQTVRPDE